MQALIFDFDGTILDTELTEFQAWQEAYKQHGAELTIEVWLPLIGTNDYPFDPVAHIESLSGETLERSQIEAWVSEYKRELNEALEPLPGVLDYLHGAKEQGLRLAVASSSNRAWVEGHLERLGLLELFEVVRTREWVERTKPDPALFLRAAEGLGLEPGQTIVLEDSLNGVKAGKAAGAFTVAIPNSLTRHLDLSHADLILSSLSEMPLERLLHHTRAR